MAWIIRNSADPDLCWNNAEGWTPDDYDTFSDDEAASLRLPIGGEWEQVPWRPG